MKPLFRFAVVFHLLLAATGIARAGIFDDIGKAMDTVKRGTALLPGSVPGSVPGVTQSAEQTQYGNSNLLLPLDLVAYPRSELYRRVDNPLDRVRIPVSTPVKSPDGYIAPYAVPMEGKVTMLQFKHRSDDSPLLIRQHYEAWLAQQGFERLLICEAPCRQLPGRYDWWQSVDPSKRLDSNYLPENATYIAGYKADAMVLVGIGKQIYNYSSLVKVVQGRVLDPQPWQAVTTPRPAPPMVAPSMPAAREASEWHGKYGWQWDRIPAGTKVRMIGYNNGPTTLYKQQGNNGSAVGVLAASEEAEFLGKEKDGWVQIRSTLGEGWVDHREMEPLATGPTKAGSGAPAGAEHGSSKTEVIAPDQLAARLAQSKGLVVVQFSSSDPGCPFCVQSNPRFDTLAQVKSSSASFLRVAWQPYTQAFDDPLAVQYGLTGLPTFLTFRNGKVVKRVNGNFTAVELSNKLLPDLK